MTSSHSHDSGFHWTTGIFHHHLIYPLTTQVVGAPQMISQPVFSIFPCSPLPWDLANSRPVHSLMLPSHLFLSLPCLLPPFTVPCKIVLARPDEQEIWLCHGSLCLFTMVRRSSCGPIACWILAWTLYEMCSILQEHIISVACILLWSSAVRVHDSQAYRKMDVTRECISRILELNYRQSRINTDPWPLSDLALSEPLCSSEGTKRATTKSTSAATVQFLCL